MEVGEDLLWLTVKGVQVQRSCKSQDWILGVAAGIGVTLLQLPGSRGTVRLQLIKCLL